MDSGKAGKLFNLCDVDILTDSLGDRYVTGHDNDAYMYSTKTKHEVLRLLSE